MKGWNLEKEPDIRVADFKLAFPRLFKEIYEKAFEEGRLLGHARAVTVEKELKEKASTVPQPAEETKEGKKKRLIQEYQKAHPGASLKETILAVGKAHPELFR